MSRLRFTLLGPLEAWGDGERLRLGGTTQERVLAMLLLEPGKLVPVTRLVEAVWDATPPATAVHQVRKAVADLRRRLSGEPVIVTDGPGYRATVTEDQLDLLEFDARVRAASQALRDGRETAALEELRAGLGLWRGPVLSGAGGPLIDSAATSLEEWRLTAAEQCFELRLASGESWSLVAEIRSFAAEHPLRETLYRHLIVALYRSGRHAEALEEYQRVRELLAEELGVDPSPQLARLYEGILRGGSPELDAPPPPEEEKPRTVRETPQPSAEPTCTLPYSLPDFTGRSEELAELVDRVPPPGTRGGQCAQAVALDGMGGVGKTSLALRAAHQLADRFPDGQLYIDLGGFTPGEQQPMPPATALDHLLRALGTPSEHVPSDEEGRARLWRSTLLGRRVLLVLDNAADTAQVRPLLPVSTECLVLITSRARLLDLDGAKWMSVGVMTPDESVTLITEMLGTARVDDEPEAVRELAESCGHLPLALRLATARLRNRPQWTVRYLVERLRDETRRMDELRSGERSIAATLRLSYLTMSVKYRTAFRLLGQHPSPSIDVYSAAALLGTDPKEAEDVLERLLDIRLIEQPEIGVYSFHDLIRSFAMSVRTAETEQEDARAVERLLDYYLISTDAACDVLFPGRQRLSDNGSAYAGQTPPFPSPERVQAWFDREHEGLVAAVALADQRGYDRHTGWLTRNLSFPLNARGQFDELWRLCDGALAAARRLGDPRLLCVTLANLGVSSWKLGRFEEGLEVAAEGRDIARRLGDRHIEAHSEATIGLLNYMVGRYREALTLLERAVSRSVELNTPRVEAEGLTMLSSLHERCGDYARAAATARRAIRISRDIGYRSNEIMAVTDLAFAQVGLGDHAEADASLRRARELCDERTAPGDLALLTALSAQVADVLGETDRAHHFAEQARELALTSAMPVRRAQVENMLGTLHTRWGRYESALAHHSHAHKIASAMRFRAEEQSALQGLARVAEALGDSSLADRHRAAAAALDEARGAPEHCPAP